MGERLSGDGVPGRRPVQPGGAPSGPRDVHDTAVLERVLTAAVRAGDLDPQAEQRAVAAFRAVRAAGAHRARTRRRDDWRPPAEGRVGRRVRMTLGVAFATLTLGGVAVAAIGSAGSSTDGAGGGRGTTHPSALAPDRPGGAASSAPSVSSGGPLPTDGPDPAQDTEAHCRAYERVRGRGKALDAKVWQQLVVAAGGRAEVAAYCSGQLARATATPGRAAATGRSGEGAADAGNGTAGSTGTSGNGTSGEGAADAGNGTAGSTGTSGNGTTGNHSGGTDDAAGNGQASGGQASGGKASGGQGSGKHK
ncbi:hypothetical protein ACFYZJ_20500 [Streptomyces sp. NPDC001848]|uniref:hypothetical protein n=1 Tax=Streptomyces sp. NPDC001848 TaxID=3364618 RepID=UPI0036BF2A57